MLLKLIVARQWPCTEWTVSKLQQVILTLQSNSRRTVGLTKHKPLDHNLPRPYWCCRGLFAPSNEYQWIIRPVADIELFGSMSVIWREMRYTCHRCQPRKKTDQRGREGRIRRGRRSRSRGVALYWLRGEDEEICSEGFQVAPVNFGTRGSVKYSIYLSTPFNIWKVTDFLKVNRLPVFVLLIKLVSRWRRAWGTGRMVVTRENKITGEKLKHVAVSVCPRKFSHRMVWGVTVGSVCWKAGT